MIWGGATSSFVLEILEESSARVAPVSELVITIGGGFVGTEAMFKLRTVAPLFLAFSMTLATKVSVVWMTPFCLTNSGAARLDWSSRVQGGRRKLSRVGPCAQRLISPAQHLPILSSPIVLCYPRRAPSGSTV